MSEEARNLKAFSLQSISLSQKLLACYLAFFRIRQEPGIHGVSPIEYKVNKVSLEGYRSGHNENDSKSFDGQKPSVGSNPTPSAKSRETSKGVSLFLVMV